MTVDHFAILLVLTILLAVIAMPSPMERDLGDSSLRAVGMRLLMCGAAALAVVVYVMAERMVERLAN